MKAKLCFLLFSAILFTSCKKQDIPFTPWVLDMNQQLKAQFQFKEGSYWIYEDQNSIRDSVFVSQYETGTTDVHPNNAVPSSEFVKINLNSAVRGSWNYYLFIDFVRINGGGQWGQEGQPIYILERDSAFQFNGLTIGASFDSLEIDNTTYYDVELMHVDAETQFQPEYQFDTDLYFAPNIGVIREISYDTISGTRTWDLKRFEIR